MTARSTLRLALALFVALSALLAGCAQERAPINRVQPYALKKAFFVGADFNNTADDPEFWARTTVIDVGYGAAQDGLFTSTYAQPLSRVKWQVTEDLLIARLAYERIATSDGKGAGKMTQDGIIVAAFKITSHFDIKHAYNPTTGEELNVLEENSTDRPWNQREYIHVDWSKNENVDSYDFDTLSMMGLYGSIQYESMGYSVVDPNDENAPYFSEDNSYFDVTTKAFAKPGMADLSSLGWGIDKFPTCMLDANFAGGQAPAASCNPVELTLRHAFRKVVDSDYEPKEWDGYRFQSAGAFTGERLGYSRDYGMTDQLWHRFIERYNIWQRSHFYTNPAAMQGAIPCYTTATTPYGADPHRDADADGTEDECKAAGKGSKCDTFSQKCTLPFQQRVPKTIVWYYADGSNPEYYQGSEDAAHEWDVAMRQAVMTAKYSECKATAGENCDAAFPVWKGQQEDNEAAIALAREVDDCRHGIAYPDKGRDEAACVALADTIGASRGLAAEIIAISKQPEMLVLCHSPVEANDPGVCAPADKRLPTSLSAKACFDARTAGDKATLATSNKAVHARRGDLRFHQVNGIVEPATPSPWGIMVDGHDPLNGEEVSASINVWTYINELWSQGVVDMARYIAGELTTQDVTEGTYIKNWSAAAEAAARGGLLKGMDASEVSRRARSTGNRNLDPAGMAAFKAAHPEADELIAKTADKLSAIQATHDAPSVSSPIYLARRQAAQGTAFETALMTPMMQTLVGIVGMPLSSGLLDMTSPLRGANPTIQRNLAALKENALAARGACEMEMADAPLGIAGLGDVLQAKFGAFNPSDSPAVQQARAERMRKYLARRVQYAVVIHEMGHSMGLRHNFISSADAWGYRPQYWQLRTSDGTVTQACTNLVKDGASCVGPRYFDPVTQEERDNIIQMWMQSSVMDYAGETTQDMLGLGAYDFHAVKMFYGDVATVHADDSYTSQTQRGAGMIAKMDNFGGILGLQPSYGSTAGRTTNIHYSQLNAKFDLISGCSPVDPKAWRPGRWDDGSMGSFHPMLDGLIVSVGGQYTRCTQQRVDYVPWDSLRLPNNTEWKNTFNRGGPSIDTAGRVRVPYGFATDTWADLGNASVYRHDNGADNYEIFNFMITQPEVNHVFDNYRRGRKTFSVRGAFNRSLSRYYEKMRDGAKGLGLYRNIYRDLAVEQNLNPDDLWSYAAQNFFPDSVLAAGMVFDHFTRIAQRPEAGDHYVEVKSNIVRSTASSNGNPPPSTVRVPNGATGFMNDVSFGGRLVENTLASDKGEYDTSYTLNAGSYYEKASVSMLLTESVDNFISSTLTDFTESRYRSVSIADLFPEGYRRFVGNALTGDDFLKGPRVATSKGKPLVDADQYPQKAFGWTTWYGATPTSCFPSDGSTICGAYGQDAAAFGAPVITESLAIDPQIGFEQQKFLIAWTMLYLFENQEQNWIDQMRLWELGKDGDPGLGDGRIEFHNPDGKTYIARTSGKESIFGKTVHKGIAARVLEYANSLLKQAYVTTDGPDLDKDGKPDWYLPTVNKDGSPVVAFDPAVQSVSAASAGTPNCTATDNSGCTCQSNMACMKLQQYVEIPFYLRSAISAYHLGEPSQKGVFP